MPLTLKDSVAPPSCVCPLHPPESVNAGLVGVGLVGVGLLPPPPPQPVISRANNTTTIKDLRIETPIMQPTVAV